MKIVVLDGYALNPGDLSWDELKQLGETEIYDYTPFDKTIERAEGADIVLTNKTPLMEREISQLPRLKYIGVLATGYNVVDVEAAKKRNIVVTNVPAYGTKSVAQMTFALLLELTQHVQRHSDAVFNGEWTNSRDFCFWKYPLIELDGKTMGIIGFGNIGQAVADIAVAFGMNVLGYSRRRTDQSHRKNFRWAELDELLAESDVVSLHCPLTPETKGIVNIETLRKMKKSAFLINTGRGPLVVEEDLAYALNNDIIAGAGLDVLSVEPPKADNPLFRAKNCVITPHIAWATKEARLRLMHTAVENVKAFLKGEPVNVVNN
ncbi:glycerate dehydrogenase [Thermoclostridium stercorarium subsp. thermolacticum DSM 2910]|uniref:Glycerate dehydrogenase n=2 Tax=Thermoclostridium stercorarium TaxID=1510 RepID=A0A1B1YPD0_THEST|nr:D-2-hydroxyacid dehydrogenase [Thermoclostridium stercorarium]ANW99956.1 glycerate dehydrogenase [Thermoclostridium stercorarium subsp. thermolacticum DSM 2910]ANX02596.1 glycerate dehydrogenase [Thermoclostridium stercorarium subsp. leptospartum DSM 9219]UZQ85941.1 D-2-hydroxyacid dehydrogenase [Thermoclostridium stercorarium]